MDLYWQVFWLTRLFNILPVHLRTVDAVIEKLRDGFGFTATGIAPDFHRTSLFIPFCGNQYVTNVGLIQHLL